MFWAFCTYLLYILASASMAQHSTALIGKPKPNESAAVSRRRGLGKDMTEYVWKCICGVTKVAYIDSRSIRCNGDDGCGALYETTNKSPKGKKVWKLIGPVKSEEAETTSTVVTNDSHEQKGSYQPPVTRYICNVCNVYSFATIEEATAHERQCRYNRQHQLFQPPRYMCRVCKYYTFSSYHEACIHQQICYEHSRRYRP